jgi:hypothetical protein
VIDRVVDGRYPLTSPGGRGWDVVVERARADLRAAGCCVLTGFVRAELLDELRRECAAVAPSAYYDAETVNVYNTEPDPSLPADHPARVTVERGNAFVTRDRIPGSALIQRLYTSPEFRAFVAACFELPAVHELADELAGLCLNVIRPGRSHPWHFDTNEFAVSLLTQAPEAGGSFEYCPAIRSRTEENFADVRAVLDGDGAHLVRSRTLRPGDLQLFRGRYALHRVSTVGGTVDRHTAIFAYSERPGVVGNTARTRQLFGRVPPGHGAAKPRVRVDALLD